METRPDLTFSTNDSIEDFQIDAEFLILHVSDPLSLVALFPKIQISKFASPQL